MTNAKAMKLHLAWLKLADQYEEMSLNARKVNLHGIAAHNVEMAEKCRERSNAALRERSEPPPPHSRRGFPPMNYQMLSQALLGLTYGEMMQVAERIAAEMIDATNGDANNDITDLAHALHCAALSFSEMTPDD